MIFDELTLEDYGPYAGKQTLQLSPTDDAPVVLVGGRNGEGKTTLLEAVLHALYGARAASLIPRASSYDNYLRSTLRGHSGKDEAAVALTLRVVRDGEELELEIERRWRLNGSGVREQLNVTRNGEDDPALAEGWGDFVETMIPRGIAPLFFFDGERVEELADLDRAAATIETAVTSLLGLDIVGQLFTDLKVLERRHAPQASNGELGPKLEAAEGAVTETEAAVVGAREDLAAARSELDQTRRKLERAEEAFRSVGGTRFDERAAIDARRDEAKRRVREAAEHLRELAAGDAVFMVARRELTVLLPCAIAERQGEISKELVGVLERRDQETVAAAEAAGAGEEIIQALVAQLAEDREQRASAEILPVARLSASALAGLETFVGSGLADEEARLISALEASEAARVELEDAERAYAAVPSEEAVADSLAERERVREDLARAEARLARCLEEVEVADRAKARAEEDQERLFGLVAEAELGEGDSTRMVKHAEKARSTLAELRDRVSAHHIERISGLVQESLGDLLRKQSLISDVVIDPKTYSLELIGAGDGVAVSPERLSAGERQLTALALLWGLARASGRSLPVIIDTPLGRLDASHRSLLVERYLPHASHQVIVLSTDTELDVDRSDALDASVARRYRLEHNDRKQETRVVDGYFEGSAAPPEVLAA